VLATLSDYEPVAGAEAVKELRTLARSLKGKRLQNVSSICVGGGAVETLSRSVPLFRELGVDATWDVMRGGESFARTSREFYRALRSPGRITKSILHVFHDVMELNAGFLKLDGDVIILHDLPSVGLIERRNGGAARWVWHCHEPGLGGGRSLPGAVLERFDAAVFSDPGFARTLSIPQYVVPPAIDPLCENNRALPHAALDAAVAKCGLDRGRPVLTHTSCFDGLKDALAAITVYRMVKQAHDSQLVLAGAQAVAGSRSPGDWRELRAASAGDPDVHVLLPSALSELEMNALVRASTIVLQGPPPEEGSLAASEALWKSKPVVGIEVRAGEWQVIDGHNGFLARSPEEAAERVIELLQDETLRRRMGENGRRHVRRNFLLTRYVRDVLRLMHAVEHPEKARRVQKVVELRTGGRSPDPTSTAPFDSKRRS
jgi:trehalose synthase